MTDLVGLYSRGLTLREIAALLSISHSTVRRRLKAANVTMRRGGAPKGRPKKRRNAERDAGIRAALQSGAKLEDLASRHGVTIQRISQIGKGE